MHFHLPKPLHGWREFVGEVGIIVIGVLIALGAEQMVEAMHWRHTIEAERNALNDDVRAMWGAMSARAVIQKCVDTRLDDIGVVLARHKRGEPLGIVAPIGRPGVWTADSGALQMASADQTLSHMTFGEKSAYFHVYGSYDTFAPIAKEERESWRTLEALNDPTELDEEDWRELRKAYRDAVDTNKVMKSELVFGPRGQWLNGFRRFPRMADSNSALSLWMVKQLCQPAVTRS